MPIQALILAGGRSSRMGSRKELLKLPDNTPLYLHLIKILREACPDIDVIHISLSDRSAAFDLQVEKYAKLEAEDTFVFSKGGPFEIHMIYDDVHQDTEAESKPIDIGPAAGLLAAYRTDPTSSWLVVACDFPLLTPSAIQLLRREFAAPLTCYRNAESYCEPLLAIWTPDAFKKLEYNVNHGRCGPRRVIQELATKKVSAEDDSWLFNANTILDWHNALNAMENYNFNKSPRGRKAT